LHWIFKGLFKDILCGHKLAHDICNVKRILIWKQFFNKLSQAFIWSLPSACLDLRSGHSKKGLMILKNGGKTVIIQNQQSQNWLQLHMAKTGEKYVKGIFLDFFMYLYMWMRSSRVVRASDCQCQSRNSPEAPSILRHNGMWGAAEEAVLNKEHGEKDGRPLPRGNLNILLQVRELMAEIVRSPPQLTLYPTSSNHRNWQAPVVKTARKRWPTALPRGNLS
jgi:hypothetical protein